MPEMLFEIRWPDGSTERCYSPSLVVKDHLEPGRAYPLPDFMDRARLALTTASERVRAKYGFPCSRALGQLARLDARAAGFAGDSASCVTVERFEE